MDNLFGTALLLYFVLLVGNLVLGSLFINELKENQNQFWVQWGKPSSMFSPRKQNLDVYKFILLSKKEDFCGQLKFYRLSKLLVTSTFATHLSFFALVFVFLMG